MTVWDEIRDLIDVPGTYRLIARLAELDDAGQRELARDLVGTRETYRLIARLAELDDAGRREVARELPGHIPVLRARSAANQQARWENYERVQEEREARRAELRRQRELAGRNAYEQDGEDDETHGRDDWSEIWALNRREDDWIRLMRIAGVATIGGAAAAAAWIGRRDFADSEISSDEISLILRAIGARPQKWRADLAVRLALRLRARRRETDPALPLALALLRDTGATPPEHDPLVVGWVSTTPSARQLLKDPLLDTLLPRIFEAEGVGRALRDERSRPLQPHSWLAALTTLSKEGGVSREMLLDGCVSRFLRGGDGPDLRFFARLHELLEPTSVEVEARARDYLRLLPAAPGPVAELSLKHLRRLGHLDPADVTEALSDLLFRAESGLVRAGLTWLDQTVRQSPERADELAPALASAFGHEAYAVQERAVSLAVKHAAHFTPLGAETLRAALATLPPDLGRQLAEAVAGEAELEGTHEAFTPPVLDAPEPPGPFPALIGTIAELASLPRPRTWQLDENWLAGFVRFAHEDREALRAALTGFARGLLYEHYKKESWHWPMQWFVAMAEELVSPGTDPGPPVEKPQVFESGVPRLPRENTVSRPHRFLMRRCAEVLGALKADVLPPTLLATPTSSTGHLDPAEFLNRMETVEAAGAEPLPADFQQALLRLPRTVDPEVVARAGRLTSEAGRRAARWLKDGPVEPETGVRWMYWDHSDNMREHYFDEREPRGTFEVGMDVRLRAEPTGLAFIDELFSGVPEGRWGQGEHGGHMDRWHTVLPSHRDVVAAHYLPHVLHPWDRLKEGHVELLLASEGPAGDPTGLLLALLLARQDSFQGVQVVLQMAAGGGLPAEALARQLIPLTDRTELKLSWAVAALEDAARQGSHREVWQVIRAALPYALPGAGEKPRPGVTDLVALGVTVAGWAGARGGIPELASCAERKATTAFARQCRRLHGLLTGA
ncbi:DUF6493 family protein [Streptosporangium sp. NPDC000396]|uniref:DUF6493 family protein n=1 Tax=Streptosporangium sp. NPDC000396 TaxID=3366185 RepID=UPI0036908A73